MRKFILILVGLIAFNINAQKNILPEKDIKATFNIYLDNKKVETDSVLIGFVSNDKTNHYSVVTDSFNTWLSPNRTYHMVITHPNYNKQMLRIITCDTDDHIKVDIKLSSKAPDCYIGYYKYSKLLKKYIEYN